MCIFVVVSDPPRITPNFPLPFFLDTEVLEVIEATAVGNVSFGISCSQEGSASEAESARRLRVTLTMLPKPGFLTQPLPLSLRSCQGKKRGHSKYKLHHLSLLFSPVRTSTHF
jgi:hypothetical protein